ncbi:MAG: glycosyltransferase [Owenweeksia sp.]|nr:glycosyltransferase [Owenweeksia sp.]
MIVGEKMFWNDDIQNAYENHPYKEDVIFTGRLEGRGLSRVLAACHALLFVSHFEGFGIPIVEAFKCQVPVITSTTTSMPEVAGEAALPCEPDNYAQIAKAMHQLNDEKLRQALIAKGRARAEVFTWKHAADMMWQSIENTL